MIRDFFYLQKSDRKVILTLLGMLAAAFCVIFFMGEENDMTGFAGEEDSLGYANIADGADAHAAYRNNRASYSDNQASYAHNQAGYYDNSSSYSDNHSFYANGSADYPDEMGDYGGKTGNYDDKAANRLHAERFPFDPNTADSTQLLRLGLKPWQVRAIYRYRAAGGVYQKPTDFAKLYGLTVKQYRELEPYIRISKDYLPAATLIEDKGRFDAKGHEAYAIERGGNGIASESNANALKSSTNNTAQHTARYPKKIKEGEYVILNTADTAELKRVPGIGSYFARKIVEYGERLGGYVDINQLDEIEDFPADAKKYLRVSNPNPRRLNVNRLTLNELKRHPYVSYYQARAITDYRRLRGALKSLNDLSLLEDFSQEAIDRLLPYVEY